MLPNLAIMLMALIAFNLKSLCHTLNSIMIIDISTGVAVGAFENDVEALAT